MTGSGHFRRHSTTRVAVVGAGIGGIGVALELAARGVSVDLHEKGDRVHARASLANEGKIHIGYIYANDPSLRTARQMIAGAWTFSPILRDWIERDLDSRFRSGPFDYLVHRQSLLDPSTLEATYAHIAQLNREAASRPGASYFGLDAARPPQARSDAEREQRYGPDVMAAFSTPEVAVDAEAIGAALSDRVTDDPNITLRLGSDVAAASPAPDGVTLDVHRDGHDESLRYDHVVNASWEDLLRIDETAGLAAPAGSSFRLRYVLRVRAPGAQDLPCTSIVLGAFGDVVQYGSGDMFLSWYPVGRRAMTTSLHPPDGWFSAIPADEAADVRHRTHAALRAIVLQLESLDRSAVDSSVVHAGVIYARGTSDIDDRGSGFHERHAIGPRSVGRYHSLDTGKYTTAPLFARRLARRITGDDT